MSASEAVLHQFDRSEELEETTWMKTIQQALRSH